MKIKTPLQAAKKAGLPLVRIVIDRRHIWGDKIDFQSPVSNQEAVKVKRLLENVLGYKEGE